MRNWNCSLCAAAKLLEGSSNLMNVRKTSFCSWERTGGWQACREELGRGSRAGVLGVGREAPGKAQEGLAGPQMLKDLSKVFLPGQLWRAWPEAAGITVTLILMIIIVPRIY